MKLEEILIKVRNLEIDVPEAIKQIKRIVNKEVEK